MNGKTIARDATSLAVTIASGAALSEAINFGAYAQGCVVVPGTWTDANIGFQVCGTQDGTFVILRDKAGTPVQIASILTSGARAYALPAEVAGAMWVKLWSKSTTAGTESDTTQGAARALTVMVKS